MRILEPTGGQSTTKDLPFLGSAGTEKFGLILACVRNSGEEPNLSRNALTTEIRQIRDLCAASDLRIPAGIRPSGVALRTDTNGVLLLLFPAHPSEHRAQ